MAIDAGGVWPNPAARRGTLSTYKFRVREERKKVIRISNAKYRNIDDHENGLRRFVLIRNTLRRLQREAREEKLARHRALASNVSPSYLSASRPRSPSPPCDMQVSDVLSVYAQPTPTPITALEEEDPTPPPKKPRLFLDDDKENDGSSCESRMECDAESKEEARMIVVDDTQEILRDLYETYTGESLSHQTRPGTPTPPPRPDTPYTASYSCTLPSTTPSSLAATAITTSNSLNSNNNNNNNNNNNSSSNNNTTTTTSSSSTSTTTSMSTGSSSYHDWSRPQQQQYACGHASLLGNDLQSVVFHSLIASLES